CAFEVHLDHLLAGIFGGLFDRGRNFVGFAVTDADVAAAVAGDDQRTEAEGSPAFDDFRAAIDANDRRFDAGFIALVTSLAASTPSAAAVTGASSASAASTPSPTARMLA